MARPRKNQIRLIEKRNEMIIAALYDKSAGLNQSDVAFIFRLPRNTISTINKKYADKGKRASSAPAA